VVGGDQDRLLRGEPGGLADVRLGGVGVLVRVFGAGQGDQGAHRLHRFLAAGHIGQARGHQGAERAAGGDLAGVSGQFGAAGGVATLQQVGDLLEGRRARELVNVVSAVEQQAGPAIDIAQRC